jgi:DNA-binding transcriptional regulator YiaG
MFIEQSDQSRKFAPNSANVRSGISLSNLRDTFSDRRRHRSKMSLIIGLVFRRSLYAEHDEWHCGSVNTLRELRRDASLSQRALADLLDVPVNTLRMWDSGLRPAPAHMLLRVRKAIACHAERTELMPLAQLAQEFHVPVRTLQAAVRTGRLTAHFSVKSVFGRPRRLATRAAVEQFIARHYRCFSGQEICPTPLPTVPNDYDKRLRAVRLRERPDPRRPGSWYWRRRQSRGLSVGITEANAVPRSMAACPRTRRPASAALVPVRE